VVSIGRCARSTQWTADLLALADWLSSLGVTHVALESTGVYWRPVVRREALFDREGMKGPLLQDRRSGLLKLRAARPRRRWGRWEQP
jgi:hypothetical protein